MDGSYRGWTQQHMDRAVAAVLNGSSIWQAALEYGISKSSLGDRVSRCVLVDASCGPSIYLSATEESQDWSLF